jgi:hypothetical protein
VEFGLGVLGFFYEFLEGFGFDREVFWGGRGAMLGQAKVILG